MPYEPTLPVFSARIPDCIPAETASAWPQDDGQVGMGLLGRRTAIVQVIVGQQKALIGRTGPKGKIGKRQLLAVSRGFLSRSDLSVTIRFDSLG